MTDNLFKITPTPPTSIQVEPGQEGKFSFTVESLAAPDKVHDVMLQALLVGDGEDRKGKEADWLAAGPRRSFAIPGGKTETVAITVKPTASTPRGQHTVKLVIADRDRPNDVFAESPSVACEVIGPPVVAPPPGKKIPWWLIAVIAGGALVLAGAVVLIVKLAGGKGTGRAPGLDEACQPDAATPCDDGLVCVAGVGRCLLPGGARCAPDEAKLCASGECDGKAGACTVPFGEACDPAEQDVAPCAKDSACDPVKKQCLGNTGAPCKANAECATDHCAGNVCAIKAPALAPGDPCEGTCPEPMQCSPTTKRCVQQNGQPCTAGNQCVTGVCDGAVCADPSPRRNCTQDGICGPDQTCIDIQPGLKRCVWLPGHPCQDGAECSSRWCNKGTCSRDDGKCASQSDCPSPYLCILAKQKCLLPINALCGGDAQCDSGFCDANRCAPSPCPAGCPPKTYCDHKERKCKPLLVRPGGFIEIDKTKIPWAIQPGSL
jgi:hypothetical protein